MNCERIDRLLALEDDDARLDAAALSKHLARCPRCAREHRDVAWLLETPAAARWRVAPVLAAAALLAIALLLRAGFVAPAPSTAGRVLPASASRVTRTFTSVRPGGATVAVIESRRFQPRSSTARSVR